MCAFLADAVAPSPETQPLGQELFSTFAKGNPPAWAASTEPGIEIEELSGTDTYDGPPQLCTSSSESEPVDEDSNGEYIEVDASEQSSMMGMLAYIAAVTRLDVRLHSVAWILSVLLHELNLVHIRICNITYVQYLILLGMLGITASVG
eukprot:2086733-Rhodomonas_salina.1